MKQICAWCGRQLNDSESHGENDVSYGICLPCANAVIVEVPNELREFLGQISVPVVLVSYEGLVQTANQQACALLGKDLSQIEGNLGGDVFECAYALLPGGCGNTYHCSGCVIRRSVQDTYQTGKPAYRIPATLKQNSPGNPQEIKFLISTEKFGAYVILKIHGEGYGA
jgi:PAS domain-containing protein